MPKMTKEAAKELIKNRKVYVNGDSKEIQEKLFECGFYWEPGGTDACNLYRPFLFIDDDMFLSHSSDMCLFCSHSNKEISAEEILSIEIEEELPSKSPSELKPFDRVLVRDVDSEKWCCSIFSHLSNETYPFNCSGNSWEQCIPYEGNEHLIGTSNSPYAK